MEAPMELRKPENWQDFETLCMKLWGEIWQCPEVKKNGRLGQRQKGVDISGKPKGQAAYYGIQCKLKATGRGVNLATTEIDQEIQEAVNFKPTLAKLYIATTAEKDASIEEYVRLKNEEHIKEGLFEVHLFCWQDIASLIEQNPGTFNFYVNNNNFPTSQRMEFVVNGEKEILNASVEFKQNITYYVKDMRFKNTAIEAILATQRMKQGIFGTHRNMMYAFPTGKSQRTVNRSLFPLQFTIKNAGTVALEHFKIKLDLQGNHMAIVESNLVSNNSISALISRIAQSRPYIKIADRYTATIIFGGKVLVGGDEYTTDPIFIRVAHAENTGITLKWEMFSKNYRAAGDFIVNIKPIIRRRRNEVIVENTKKEEVVTEEVEDIIEEEEVD